MHSEEFLAQMVHPVAIVGNGPVVGRGAEIDDCGSVIRMNNFRIEGHERDVGRRLTGWCVHGLSGHHISGATPDGTVVDRTSFWLRQFTLHHPLVSALSDDGLNMITPCARWSELARLIKPGKPSTGLILILAAASCCRRSVRLYGFDGMATGHYWDKDHRHDHPREEAAIAQIVSMAKGLITWVDP